MGKVEEEGLCLRSVIYNHFNTSPLFPIGTKSRFDFCSGSKSAFCFSRSSSIQNKVSILKETPGLWFYLADSLVFRFLFLFVCFLFIILGSHPCISFLSVD